MLLGAPAKEVWDGNFLGSAVALMTPEKKMALPLKQLVVEVPRLKWEVQ